jgi:hypothetical protein
VDKKKKKNIFGLLFAFPTPTTKLFWPLAGALRPQPTHRKQRTVSGLAVGVFVLSSINHKDQRKQFNNSINDYKARANKQTFPLLRPFFRPFIPVA